MPPKTKFQEGEKVLCFHGPLLYEAKCVKVELKDKQIRYYIHYNGWNKNWDEWVPESRVLKLNDAGLQKQKELMKAHGAARKASKGGRKSEKDKDSQKKDEKDKDKPEKDEKDKDKKPLATPAVITKKEKEKTPSAPGMAAAPHLSAPSTTTSSSVAGSTPASSDRGSAASSPAPEPKRKRPRIDPASVETEDVFVSRIEVKIKMPDELKPWLVDDWDMITRQKMLVNLPCKNTVDSIIEEYIKSRTAKSNVNKCAVLETMAGVKEYFNVMLGNQLLYKFERPQYSELLTEYPDKPMSSLYGATHLLRLFVRIGQMLAYTALDEKCVQVLLTHMHDFLKYLLKNAQTLFSHSDYGIAPPEYHRKAI